MRYFQNRNADKPVVIGAHKFNFEPTHYNEGTGSYWGLIRLDNEDHATILSSQGEKYGVSEVTEKEADLLLQKKSRYGLGGLSNKVGGRVIDKSGGVELVADGAAPPDEDESCDLETVLIATENEEETVEDAGEQAIDETEGTEEDETESLSPSPKRRGRPRKTLTE